MSGEVTRALSRRELAAATFALAITLVVLLAMRGPAMLQTSAWGYDSHLFGWRFVLQIGAIFVGTVLMQLVPERFARPILLAEGLVCMLAYGLFAALTYLVLLATWFVTLELPLPGRVPSVLAFLLLVGLGLAGALELLGRAYGFSLMFSMRLIMYAWDRAQQGHPAKGRRERLRDYFLYVLAPPLMVLPPFLTVIPFFRRFSESLAPRWNPKILERAFKHIGLAIMFGFVRRIAQEVPGLVTERLEVGPTLIRHAFVIISVAQVAHLTFGLMLMHGMDDRLPISKPVLAKNFVEYWSRFQIHQKDMQVALFYTPMLMRLRKRNRYLAITSAIAWTMLFGNTLIHFLTSYMFNLEWAPVATVSCLAANLISTVALSGTLCLAEWRTRTNRPVPKEPIYAALSWAATFLFTARADPPL